MVTSYNYEDDRIESITHNGFSYSYEYDVWGNPTAVKVGEQSLVSYTYDSENKTRDRVNRITYGNGDYTDYTYTTDGNIETIKSYSDDGTLVADYLYTYDDYGEIKKINNLIENTEIGYYEEGTLYTDLNGVSKSDNFDFYGTTVDENQNTLELLGNMLYTESEKEVHSDAETGSTTTAFSVKSSANEYFLSSETDFFGRTVNKELSYLFSDDNPYKIHFKTNEDFTYKDAENDITGNQTTNLVNSYKTLSGAYIETTEETTEEDGVTDGLFLTFDEKEFLYDYDYNGNITRIRLKTVDEENIETITELYSYVYDNVGQVVRENNAEQEKTLVYVYDKGGNIAQKKEYAYTTGTLGEAVSIVNYTYDSVWKDKLTAYGDTQIQTDAMGNPLNYTTKTILGDEVSGTLEWNGRQLSAAVVGSSRFEYQYNAEGLRTTIKEYSKFSNELQNVYYYIWKNGKLSGFVYDDKIGSNDTTVKMMYDADGEPVGYELISESQDFKELMMFQKNLQGDIIGVYNGSGLKVISYTYDAWGGIDATVVYEESVAGILEALKAIIYTPITYRGYMYDVFTGLYYLQSRYYNPAYGRFLNADSIMKTGEPLGANIFAYCGNNPVNFVDYDGRDALSIITNILYLLVVAIVMKNDGLLDEFDYIFEGATSFSYVEYVNGIITDLVVTFSHNSKISYDICIKFAHIDDWRDWEIEEEHITHVGHTAQFAFDLMLSLLGFVKIYHIGAVVSVVSVVADIWSFVDDIDDQKYVDFVHDKIQIAKNNNSEYIIFVRKIDKVTTNVLGISNTKTIYDCIEGANL